jgi:hypothetical protein
MESKVQTPSYIQEKKQKKHGNIQIAHPFVAPPQSYQNLNFNKPE